MWQKYRLLLSIIFITFSLSSYAQQETSNTLKFTESSISPNATLDDISWIQGHWKGEAFGGLLEEIWSPPFGDSMMFSFKLVVDNKVVFYEFGGIRKVDKTLVLEFKHFNADFKGWEEKDETINAKLVKIKGNRVYFDDFTFEKISDTEINLYVVIEQKEGKSEEIKFNYKK